MCIFFFCVSPQPCYERVKDWLNENLVALWIFALCTALTQVITAGKLCDFYFFSPRPFSSILAIYGTASEKGSYFEINKSNTACFLCIKRRNAGFLWTAWAHISLLCYCWRPHREVWLSIKFFYLLSSQVIRDVVSQSGWRNMLCLRTSITRGSCVAVGWFLVIH